MNYDISIYEEEHELWGWPIPSQADIDKRSFTSKNSTEDYDDLLADSADADRNRNFEGEDWGELIASGHMDEDDYALTEREQELEKEENRKWLLENRKTPEQKAEEERQRTLEQNRRRYIGTGLEDEYTPTDEDRIEREAELESIRNPQLVPF